MNRGYIKLYRKTVDSKVFQNEGLLKVWIWCLLKANHKGGWVKIRTGRGFTELWVEPGQFIYGRKTAAKELKMAPSTVRNRIRKLELMGNIVIEYAKIRSQSHFPATPLKEDTQQDTHFSLITIVNWTTYQAKNKKEDRQEDNQRTIKGHKQECKERKEDIEKGKSDHKHRAFQDWWFEKYEYKFKKKYMVTNWKQFGGQINSLLRLPLTFEDLQYLALEFFLDQDPFITGSDNGSGTGHNIGMFLTRINQNAYRKYLDPEFREKNKEHIIGENVNGSM